MIIDYEYRNRKLIVSYINQNGDIKLKYYNWGRPKKFVVTNENDNDKHPVYHTWDNKPVKWVYTTYPDKYAIFEFLDRLEDSEKEEIFAYQEPKIFFMDIETEIPDSGFVEATDASAPVQTISIVNGKKVLLLGTKSLMRGDQTRIKNDLEQHFKPLELEFEVKYISFHNSQYPEFDMLYYLFHKLIPKMPVITGWNFVYYDWTYLINRARNIGIDPSVSSLTRKLNTFMDTPEELPYHRFVVDYMDLYKKWDSSIKIKESSSLDFVSSKIFDLGKIYYEGSLQDLYNNDFRKYLFYNAVDSILVQEIHRKMKYINILYAIATLAKVRMQDAFKTIAVTEGMLREKFRDEKNIVFCKDYEKELPKFSIPGGYVKNPARKGMHTWVCVYDFSSLYPTTQRQNNIAPEVFKGMKINQNQADFNGKINNIEDDDIVLVNNSVFSREHSSTVDFLSTNYYKRKKYKKNMNKKKEELDKLEKKLKEIEKLYY